MGYIVSRWKCGCHIRYLSCTRRWAAARRRTDSLRCLSSRQHPRPHSDIDVVHTALHLQSSAGKEPHCCTGENSSACSVVQHLPSRLRVDAVQLRPQSGVRTGGCSKDGTEGSRTAGRKQQGRPISLRRTVNSREPQAALARARRRRKGRTEHSEFIEPVSAVPLPLQRDLTD